MNCLCIAGQKVRLRPETAEDMASLPALKGFVRRLPDGQAGPSIRVIPHRRRPVFSLPDGTASAGSWRLYCDDQRLAAADRWRYMHIDRYAGGTLHLFPAAAQVFRRYPLQHPFDKLIFSYLLSRKDGAILHACGVCFRSRGMVFPGASGAGKTTLARLWQAYMPQAEVLSDDRVAVRRVKRGFRLYGTPWHGDAAVSSSSSCPVHALYFPVQARDNRLSRMSAHRAVQLLAAGSLSWCCHRYLVRTALDVFALLCETVPCFEFRFTPERSAIDYLVSCL